MRVPKAVLGGFLIVALAAAVYFLVLAKDPPTAADQAGSAPAASADASTSPAPDQKTEAAPLPVKVDKAFVGDLVMTLRSPGEAYTEKKITMKAEVGGDVKNLYAAEGKHVREGDLLIELDDREYRLRLESAEAMRLRYLSELFLDRQFALAPSAPSKDVTDRLTKAQADYDRVSKGFKSGVASEADLEKAQAALELALIESGRKRDEVQAATKGLTQAEVDVKVARLNLEKTRIRAPFSGILTDIKISPKERVDVGRELFTLVDISRIKVEAKVLESEVGKVV
ncbi:MAG TPA: HlyD family efflux transporter periplasmic adaptor subunit, partial [Candidatus Bathyarchaeia archaeon]|nr:HlyD family efflux transporter periplasmic adaptor subunit [Candidatus Bathyarchaeia archaeon]